MIDRRIRSIVHDAAAIDVDAQGVTRVAPHSEEECALILSTATTHGWGVRIEGNSSWIAPGGPADIAVTTRNMQGIADVSPADLVASVRAGTDWSELRLALLDYGVWIPLDPPGSKRSVGSVVATATAGPLRSGFGTLRDQILGLTIVTGDGRIIRAGGRVVKNVAGYDITKLTAGSFGAFGVITSVNFRVRTAPRADVTHLVQGDRDTLIGAARAALHSGVTPAAFELASPHAAGADQWTLALRSLGSVQFVAAQTSVVADAIAPLALEELDPTRAARFWGRIAAGATEAESTLRLGVLPSAVETALDVVAHHLDERCEDWITTTLTTGSTRWSGTAPADRIRLLRGVCAQQEIPLTLERAPWAVRSVVGHYGAYRERVAGIVQLVRRAFDPGDVLAVPLSADL